MLTRPILVAYASRHHGTEEMASEIAAALRDAGFSVDLRAAGEVATTGAVQGRSSSAARSTWPDGNAPPSS